MLLLFPCPCTIPVPSCRPSCQTSCSTPPSSGCAATLSSRLSIKVGSRDEIVSVSHLKACMEADPTPGSPRRCSRPLGKHPGGPTATKRVSFSDLLVFTFSSGAAKGQSRNSFSGRGPVFCTPATPSISTAAVPAPSAVTASRDWTSDLSSSCRCQSSGGALWRPGNIPG